MINITAGFAAAFADEWIASWNSHDINRIMEHYSENFIIESRIASRLVPESGGVIAGKHAVRTYWMKGLSLNTNLRFSLLDVLFGMNGLSIYYVNTANQLRAVEMMIFNDEGKVIKAYVHHSE